MKKLIVFFLLFLGLSVGSVWAMEGDPVDKSGGDDRDPASMVLGQFVTRAQSPKRVTSLECFNEKIGINLTQKDFVDFFCLKNQFRNIAKDSGSYSYISFDKYPTEQLKKIVKLTEELGKEKLSLPSSFEESHFGSMKIYVEVEVENREEK